MIRFSVILLALFTFLSPKIYSSEGSTYSFDWLDPDKEVYVLQNRKFRKDKSFYLNLGIGYTFSEPFWNGFNGTLRAGYFFWEEWGLEAIYSYVNGSENSAAESVRPSPGSPLGSIPFRRITTGYGGLIVTWSPFYSKSNFFNGIVYSDWIIGLGVVSLSEENNQNEVESGGFDTTPTKESHIGLLIELGWQFYISKHWHLRTDITGVNYTADGIGSQAGESQYYGVWDFAISGGFRF